VANHLQEGNPGAAGTCADWGAATDSTPAYVQQCEATEALRAALGRIEAALMAREQKLADSWKVLRVHADSLRSEIPTPADSGLAVSSS